MDEFGTQPEGTIIVDCPLCGVKRQTFDVLAHTYSPEDDRFLNVVELQLSACCRTCRRISLLHARTDVDVDWFPVNVEEQIGLHFQKPWDQFLGVIGILRPPGHSEDAPEGTPPMIANLFREATTCITTNCPNAACTMFRTVLDLTTKDKLPPGDGSNGGANKIVRKDLKTRIQYLRDKDLITGRCFEFSETIRLDGKDGAHDGNITMDEAKDLLDFAREVLREAYEGPKKLADAEARRNKRNEPVAEAESFDDDNMPF